jgi:hypothetical protein
MSQETTDAGKQGNWRLLLAALVSNIVALAHLEPLRAQLAAQLDKLVEIHNQQAAFIASKQEMSKQLRDVVIEGDRLATLLRSSVKQHYGIRSEKVAEFGVKPFRGRARKVTPAPEPPTAPPPPVPAATK